MQGSFYFPIEYIAYDVEELLAEFDEDPLKAVEKYSGMYVKLRGQFLLVHSNGEFLCLTPTDKLQINNIKKYSGMYVKLRGQFLLVHSNGEFLCLTPTDKLQINNIICFIMNKKQLNKALEKKTGDIIVVNGQLNEVDEDLGYTLDIHTIE